MALNYFRIHVDDKSRIVAISERWLDQQGSLVVRTAWDHKLGERGVIEDFLVSSHFWSNKWTYVPVGLYLPDQLAMLFRRCSHYGLLPWNADPLKVKPSMDLSPVLAMLNSDNRRPDGAYGDAPDCFYGASLEKFTFRNIDAQSIAALVANRQFTAARNLIEREAEAFWDLYVVLKDAMVVLRESVIFPAFRPPRGNAPEPIEDTVL